MKVFTLTKMMPMASNARRQESLRDGRDTVHFPSAKAAREYRDQEDTTETNIETISFTGYCPEQDPRVDWESPSSITEAAIETAKNGNMKAAKVILETYAEDCKHNQLLAVVQNLQKNWGQKSEWSDEMRELEGHVKDVYNAESYLEKREARVRV